MKSIKVLTSATLLAIVSSMSHLALAAVAAPALTPPQLNLLIGNENANIQTVHCRRFVHVHRRCVVWRGGVCRRWVRYRHRCG